MTEGPEVAGDLAGLVVDAIVAATERLTGSAGQPLRPGQVALARDIADTMEDAGHVAGIAPTGTGKGLAYGLPAALAAAVGGQRTLVSTESKALQAQLVDKDLPLVADVVEGLTGVRVSFAVHQGFANHGCPLAAGQVVADAGEGAPARIVAGGKVFAGAEAAALADLARWVVAQSADSEALADRSTYPGEVDAQAWVQVSTSPESCLGGKCPRHEVCPPLRARARAGKADIVVANHTLLALQAATGAPIVIGNKTLGPFDHLVVDEAHALPGTVRSTGARRIGAPRVRRLTAAVGHLVTGKGAAHNPAGDRWVTRGRDLADRLEDVLSAFAAAGGGSPVEFRADTFPVPAGLRSALHAWLAAGRDLMSPAERQTSSDDARRRLRSARYALAGLDDDLDEAVEPSRGYARWVEAVDRAGERSSAACLSPVDVSDGISTQLYSRPAAAGDGDDDGEDGAGHRVGLSVTMVSATLQGGFADQVGLQGPTRRYPSPFEAAYARSLLYVPRVCAPEGLERIARRNGRRWSLDVGLHRVWAAGLVCELVAANGGSALVLASTSSAGQAYASQLRRAGLGMEVLSQWDGADPRRTVAAWRDDASSVLVGTRSLMTGVDAAGESCSLVVIDRVPRNPGNVVDDARARQVQASAGLDRWSAARAVYAADAALLLAQAAGRLVRSVGDSGMVAVLDPRLMRGTPVSYQEPTRAVYMGALAAFPGRTGSLQQACDWLAARRAWLDGEGRASA